MYNPKSISELLLIAEAQAPGDEPVKRLVMSIRENDYTWHAARSRIDAVLNRLPPILGRHASLDTTVIDAAASIHKAEHTIFYLSTMLAARLNELDISVEW